MHASYLLHLRYVRVFIHFLFLAGRQCCVADTLEGQRQMPEQSPQRDLLECSMECSMECSIECSMECLMECTDGCTMYDATRSLYVTSHPLHVPSRTLHVTSRALHVASCTQYAAAWAPARCILYSVCWPGPLHVTAFATPVTHRVSCMLHHAACM